MCACKSTVHLRAHFIFFFCCLLVRIVYIRSVLSSHCKKRETCFWWDIHGWELVWKFSVLLSFHIVWFAVFALQYLLFPLFLFACFVSPNKVEDIITFCNIQRKKYLAFSFLLINFYFPCIPVMFLDGDQIHVDTDYSFC
ncbi:hypothetical protein BZA77DRAFT_169951 [Pyronema omphalodes]|nr:hypothetical protein BZA77DRAFT_169951 [Pyronema omphalodes]